MYFCYISNKFFKLKFRANCWKMSIFPQLISYVIVSKISIFLIKLAKYYFEVMREIPDLQKHLYSWNESYYMSEIKYKTALSIFRFLYNYPAVDFLCVVVSIFCYSAAAFLNYFSNYTPSKHTQFDENFKPPQGHFISKIEMSRSHSKIN